MIPLCTSTSLPDVSPHFRVSVEPPALSREQSLSGLTSPQGGFFNLTDLGPFSNFIFIEVEELYVILTIWFASTFAALLVFSTELSNWKKEVFNSLLTFFPHTNKTFEVPLGWVKKSQPWYPCSSSILVIEGEVGVVDGVASA